MFAQGFHPSMRFAAGPRREIGIRTVFNILGPLTNPAGAGAQVIGVADAPMAAKMAQALSRLGSKRALVVHGNDGLDEITIADSTQVWELNEGAVSEYSISPEDLGLDKSPLSEVQVSNTAQSAQTLRDVLDGGTSAARDIVLLNAAAALLAGGQVDSLQDGVAAAAKSIDEGSANSRMEAFIALSQSLE